MNVCYQEIVDLKEACQLPTAAVPVPEAVAADTPETPPEAPLEGASTEGVSGDPSAADEDDPDAGGTAPQDTGGDSAAPASDDVTPTTLQRRLHNLNIFADEGSEEPPSRDHCCAPNPDLPGCSFNEGLSATDPRVRIGLLETEAQAQRPLFTENRVVVEEYYREFREYCRMNRLKRASEIGSPETAANWLGAQKWRWLLFVALYFPLGPVSHAIAGIFSYFVTSFSIGGRNVRARALSPT